MKRGQFSQEQIVAILHEARVLVEAFRREYNEERPHQSLGYKPPQEYKDEWHEIHSQPSGD